MLCDNCGQNDASVKYTQIVNGIRKEMNLCYECSNKLNLNEFGFSVPFSFSNFFENFLNDYDNSVVLPVVNRQKQLKCDKCNMTYGEFLGSGKLGCSNCYNVFSDKIDYVLDKLHGSNRYVGKSFVKKSDSKIDIENLKSNLEKLIKEENYEEAAIIRDKIKKIENNNFKIN